MEAIVVDSPISASEVKKLLGRVRNYDEKPISAATLWRWRDLLGISSDGGRKCSYTPAEIKALSRLAEYFKIGLSVDMILEILPEQEWFHEISRNLAE